MSPQADIEGLVDDFAAEQDELRGLLASLADEDWTHPTPAAGWDVRDQVSHLADTEEWAVDTLTGGPRAINEVVAERRRQGSAHRPAATELAAAVFATDPVCGMAVEIKAGAVTAELDGVTHYFCGPGCRAAFLAPAPA